MHYLWAKVEKEKAERAAKWPSEQDAINTIQQCYHRLRELGWNDPRYCPKNGDPLDLIEAGSSGIHRGHYMGEWPDGGWWVHDGGDLWPSHPFLARTALQETAKMEAQSHVG